MRRDLGELSEYVRRDIRKSSKIWELICIKEHSQGDVENLYQLYLTSMERNRAAAKYPLQWFDAVYEIICERHVGRFPLCQ